MNDNFNNHTFDMGYSYSSGSNDSEPSLYDDWVFKSPASYGTETPLWPPYLSTVDDMNGWSTEIPTWQTPMTVRGAYFGAGFSDPGFKFNPPTETQPHNAGSLEEEMMATSPSEPPSLPSASPPEKPSRSVQCPQCGKPFTRGADVRRHELSVHNPVFEDCPIPRCPRKGKNGLSRKDHLIEHMRSYHHMDIPKRAMGKKKSTKNDTTSFFLA